jgi:hypothetical protein
MPVMPMYFQAGSFQDNNPALAGMQSMGDIIGKQIQNQFAPQMNMQDLQRQQLANQLSQINLQYAPQMTRADLADKLAQANQSNAQAGYLGAETKYFPLDSLVKAQQTAQTGSRFGAAFQTAKMLNEMDPGTRATWIAQNKDAYADTLTTLANSTNNQSNYITPELMNRFFPGMINSQQGAQKQNNPPQANNLPSQIGQNNPQNISPINTGSMSMSPTLMAAVGQNEGQPVNIPQGAQRFTPSTPAQRQQLELASQMAANKYNTTSGTRNQLEGGVQVEGMFNDPTFQKQAQSAALYAGALGKGQSFADALSQQNPQAYEDYLSFKDQTMPLFLNRIKSLEKMGATDDQRVEMHSTYKKALDSLTSNPDQFIQQMNSLGSTIDTVAKQVQNSASPLFKVNRLSGFTPINNPYSQNNSQASAPNVVTIIDPSGAPHKVDRANLDAALKRYPGTRLAG